MRRMISFLIFGLLIMFGCIDLNQIHYFIQGIDINAEPSQVVLEFNKAVWVKCNYFHMKDYSTRYCWEHDCRSKFVSVYPICRHRKGWSIVDYEVIDETIQGDDAVVSVNLCVRRGDNPEMCLRETYFLKRVKNRWLVDGIERLDLQSNVPDTVEDYNTSPIEEEDNSNEITDVSQGLPQNGSVSPDETDTDEQVMDETNSTHNHDIQTIQSDATEPSSDSSHPSEDSSTDTINVYETNVNVTQMNTIELRLPDVIYQVEVVDFGPGYTEEQDTLYLDVYRLDPRTGNETLVDKYVPLEKCLLNRTNCSGREKLTLDGCVLTYRYGRAPYCIPEASAMIDIRCEGYDDVRIDVFRRYDLLYQQTISLNWSGLGESQLISLKKRGKVYTFNITFVDPSHLIISDGSNTWDLWTCGSIPSKIYDDLYLIFWVGEKDDTYITKLYVFGNYQKE